MEESINLCYKKFGRVDVRKISLTGIAYSPEDNSRIRDMIEKVIQLCLRYCDCIESAR